MDRQKFINQCAAIFSTMMHHKGTSIKMKPSTDGRIFTPVDDVVTRLVIALARDIIEAGVNTQDQFLKVVVRLKRAGWPGQNFGQLPSLERCKEFINSDIDIADQLTFARIEFMKVVKAGNPYLRYRFEDKAIHRAATIMGESIQALNEEYARGIAAENRIIERFNLAYKQAAQEIAAGTRVDIWQELNGGHQATERKFIQANYLPADKHLLLAPAEDELKEIESENKDAGIVDYLMMRERHGGYEKEKAVIKSMWSMGYEHAYIMKNIAIKDENLVAEIYKDCIQEILSGAK